MSTLQQAVLRLKLINSSSVGDLWQICLKYMQDNWGLIQAEYKWFYGPQMFQGVGEFGILEVRTV